LAARRSLSMLRLAAKAARHSGRVSSLDPTAYDHSIGRTTCLKPPDTIATSELPLRLQFLSLVSPPAVRRPRMNFR
jgi:hypothetical protein